MDAAWCKQGYASEEVKEELEYDSSQQGTSASSSWEVGHSQRSSRIQAGDMSAEPPQKRSRPH